MKCITLTASLLTIAAGAPFVAAQTPAPAPPARTPAPARPAPAPRAVRARPLIDEDAVEEMRASAMALRASQADMTRMDHELMAVQHTMTVDAIREARIDMEVTRAAMAVAPLAGMVDITPIPDLPGMPALLPMPAIAPMALFDADRFDHRVPPQGWAPGG